MPRDPVHLVLIVVGLLSTNTIFAQGGQTLPDPVLQDARIQIDNRADADGVIRVRVVPVGREPIETRINVLNNMSENEIAADIEKELTVTLGDLYRVDRTGGENVRIRKRDRDTPDFTLEVAFNTPGLAITIQD